jgi:LacI family transcriptional regulator
VVQAAETLGYRSNAIARAMRSGRTSTIGLVIADISGSFFDRATLAIIRTAAASGYQTLVLNTDEDLEAEADAVGVLLNKRVDGLIVVTSSRTGHDHLLDGDQLVAPLVFLDRRADDVPACVVSTDDRSAAREAVAIFVEHGRRKIGMLSTSSTIAGRRLSYTSPQAISTMSDRVGGFQEGLAAAGLEFREDWLVFTDTDHETATAAAIELLSRRERPTAILASNSETALALLQACQQLDLKVAEDLSLIGFDDPTWARLMRPALTMVSRPVYELGSAAVEKLLLQITGEHDRPDSLTLPAQIVPRDSVARLA